MIGNKITKISNTSQRNKSGIFTNERDKKISKKDIYPEERQRTVDNSLICSDNAVKIYHIRSKGTFK